MFGIVWPTTSNVGFLHLKTWGRKINNRGFQQPKVIKNGMFSTGGAPDRWQSWFITSGTRVYGDEITVASNLTFRGTSL